MWKQLVKNSTSHSPKATSIMYPLARLANGVARGVGYIAVYVFRGKKWLLKML